MGVDAVAFGSRLKQLRKRKGITQDTLAKAVQSSYQRISQYENGKMIPTIDTIYELANYFNCGIDYLFGLKDLDGKVISDGRMFN